MLAGVLPAQSGGAPSTSDLASICTKTTDVQAYAAAKSLKVKSLYRLNDPGIFGDSSYGTITGYLSGASGDKRRDGDAQCRLDAVRLSRALSTGIGDGEADRRRPASCKPCDYWPFDDLQSGNRGL